MEYQETVLRGIDAVTEPEPAPMPRYEIRIAVSTDAGPLKILSSVEGIIPILEALLDGVISADGVSVRRGLDS